MQLHVFAHFGEARSFLENKSCVKVPLAGVNQLYRSGDDYLLITGEGFMAVTVTLSALLAHLHQEIHNIINWGIAGLLTTAVRVGEVHSIRTVYGQRDEEGFEFKSYTLDDLNASCDVISARGRIHSPNEAKHLARVAPCVDRELWAIALVAKHFAKPLRAFKCISDDAHVEACRQIRDEAEKWSDLLWQQYEMFIKESQTLARGTEISLVQKLPTEAFYLTHSQNQRLTRLWEMLLEKGVAESELLARSQKIAGESAKPKQRASLLIQELERRLQPVTTKLVADMEAYLQPLKRAGILVEYDKQFESEDLKLHMKIRSQKDLQNHLAALQKMDFDFLESFFRGDHLEV